MQDWNGINGINDYVGPSESRGVETSSGLARNQSFDIIADTDKHKQKLILLSNQLEKWAAERWMKGVGWEKLTFSPDKLEVNWDLITYNPQVLWDFPHLFIQKDGTFEEINLLPNKLQLRPDDKWYSLIPYKIKNVGDWFYLVTLAHHCKQFKSRWMKWEVDLWFPTESYVIDRDGNIVDQIWKLGIFEDESGIHSKESWKNNWWFREVRAEEYTKEWQKVSWNITIYGDNMDVLFTLDSEKLSLQYCSKEMCLCQDKINPMKYYSITVDWDRKDLTKEEFISLFQKLNAKD